MSEAPTQEEMRQVISALVSQAPEDILALMLQPPEHHYSRPERRRITIWVRSRLKEPYRSAFKTLSCPCPRCEPQAAA